MRVCLKPCIRDMVLDQRQINIGGIYFEVYYFNTLRPRQNGRHFADDISKCIFLNENVWIPVKISLRFVPKGPVNNISALVYIMAWRRSGDKPLSEPMMVILPTHICITRPQWVDCRHRFNAVKLDLEEMRCLAHWKYCAWHIACIYDLATQIVLCIREKTIGK